MDGIAFESAVFVHTSDQFPYFRLTDSGFQVCITMFAMWAVIRGLIAFGKKWKRSYHIKKEPNDYE